MSGTGTRHGFTLIELLVVIAIIAILAAILFPVFVSAKDAAAKSACLNYLSELGKAQLMYRDQYNDRLPLHFGYVAGVEGTGCYGDYVAYYMLLAKYTKTKTGSFQCPATYTKVTWTIVNGQRVTQPGFGPGMYSCWASGIGVIPGTAEQKADYLEKRFGYRWLSEWETTSYAALLYPQNAGEPREEWDVYVVSSKYRRPSSKLYLFEATWDVCNWHEFLMNPAEGNSPGMAPRHAGGSVANVLFYDGHCKGLDKDYIYNHADVLLGYDENPDK